MWHTGTNEQIEYEMIPGRLLDFYSRDKGFEDPFDIVIGTDSQNFSDTKVVTVIAMICQGHGGIFFYHITHIDKIMDVRQKLHMETEDSLRVAEDITDRLTAGGRYKGLNDNCPVSIHVDVGNSPKGKTRELIPGIIGWVKGCGYNVKIKPDSFAASSIADKISK